MAERPVFFPRFDAVGVSERYHEFEWFPGFAPSQKRKCVASLHDAVRREKPDARVLEVSRRSETEAGVALSAFNLKLPIGGVPCSVESVFQASKVFVCLAKDELDAPIQLSFEMHEALGNRTGPFPELYPRDPREVRRIVRERSDDCTVFIRIMDYVDEKPAFHRLSSFKLDGVRWPLEPKTAFYDWLYLNALKANPELAAAVETYDAFTDIEFNPDRSLNCQARSAALWISLRHAGLLDEALSSREAFLRIHPA